MPPRRKTKKTAEADTADNASARSTPPPSGAFTIGPLLQGVDLDALSNFFPDASLETPSAVLVVQCYKLILNQAQQLDEKERNIEALESEAERKEIELDQALQDKENLLAELDTGVNDVREELAKVKKDKEEIAASRAALQAELEKTTTSQSSSSHEVTTLKKKIEEVEREKRELLGVVSRLQEDVAQRDEEITTLREDLRTARREAQEVESTLRDIRASERSTVFKVETLTHQLQLAKDENDRTNAELAKKTEEYSTYRRDKHTELVQLQGELDSIKQTHNQTLTTLRALQSSHQSQSQQLASALQKVEGLTGQLADQEAKYSSEAANLRRLVQMLEERENQAKELVAGIERDWEGLGEKAAENERKLLSELETAKNRARELEEEVEHLRTVADRVSSGELPVPSTSAAQASPDVSSDSLFSISPNISIISRMQKSGKTFTEVYTDYVKVQQQLAQVTREKDNLDQTLARVLAELEENAPALHEQKTQIERLQVETNQLSTQVAQALAERDAAFAQVQNTNKALEEAHKEIKKLDQTVADDEEQLRGVLRELNRVHDPTLPSDQDMQDIPPAANIEEIITNNLVLYRSIPELQEQNRRLLQCVRELGARMESEEREYKAEQQGAVNEAYRVLEGAKKEMEAKERNYQLTIQTLAQERDTMKTMLARLEKGDATSAAVAGTAVDGAQVGSGSPGVNGAAQVPTDIEKGLEEERTKFEAYRKEMGIDTVKLREEAVRYQREAGQLGVGLAKANAKIEYLNERLRMSHERYVMQGREIQDMQNRNKQLQDEHTRLDIACNQAAEEIHDAHAQIERLRNDCSNLLAEKKVWENVQTRLLDENKVLSLERSRMADLIGNVQKMHNDIDRANDNDRRRFESQIHTLDAQTQDLRTQLSRERETVRQVRLQKDIEVQELRTKIDRSVENLSKAREALVEAETSRKHLQERVNELVKQVQVNEEKLAVYERRTTVTAGAVPAQPPANGEDADQDLKAEIAELRASLKAAEVDLAAARSHVQQYQEISQASEAALQSLSATHDEYKASTEAQISKYEADGKALEEKITSLQEDINRLNAKNAELQQTLEKERVAFAQDKKMLEYSIVDITNAEANSRNDQANRESELREQIERAKTAEEKYAREIVAHAESIKVVDDLKKQLKEARATAREKTVQAETAQVNITASEASWNQQREALNKEIADLTAHGKDLAAQNALLHQHLEAVSSQASRIRQAADSDVNMSETGDGDDADGRISELRSVIAYLRKEKEIVDLQLELAKQESARQKTQIAHLSQALEETRTTLSNEREEAAKAVGNSAEHEELLERINQLNILRESNATLRAESEAHLRKARQLETTLNHLQSEVGPLKEEARTLRAELDAKNAQIQRLEDENRQWKERNTQLLTKYDRIDPSDVQALKDEIEDLQIDLRKAEEEKAAYTTEKEAQAKLLEDTQATLTEFRSKYTALGHESRNRLGQLNQQIAKLNETVSDLRKQVKELTAEKERLSSQAAATAAAPSADLTAELESLKAQLAIAVQGKESSVKSLADEMDKAAKVAADHEAALSALREERDRLLAEKSSAQAIEAQQPDSGDASQIRQQLETEKAELAKARDEALARAKAAEERTVKVLNEARNIRLQNEKFQARIAENEKRRIADGEKIAALMERHKQEQEQAVTEATGKLRAELQNPGADTSEIAARHAEELRSLEARLVAKHEEDLKAAIEKAREEATKAAASATRNAQDMISKEEYEQALKAATERGRMESTTKIKLKDGMLQKAQANVKHLEAQIKAWREAGIVPANAPTIPAGSVTTPVKASTTVPVPAKSVAAGISTAHATRAATHAGGPSTAAATPAVLPKKPTLGSTGAASPTAHAAGGADASARGTRGGAVRGVRGARGITRGGAVRGGAPAAVAQAAQAAAANATDGVVSIMGAATKRAREEVTESTTESLAKRIKPAEGAAKPVALRRDRIATTS